MKHKLAAQLHTARHELAEDYRGGMRKLRDMGWPAVQIGGYYGHTAEQVAGYVEENGFEVAGMHVDLSRLTDDLANVLKEARRFGTRDLVCPSVPKPMQNPQGYAELRRILNEVARRVEPEGIRISYHNHAFEFETDVEGKPALAYIVEPSPDNRIWAEFDVYWVKKGGCDPLTFMQPYAGRIPLIHLKDMTSDDKMTFAEIGTGSIDFAPILRWGEQSGVEWYIVEQDVCPGNALDSLQISLRSLHKLADGLAAAEGRSV
ncbi:MAG: xylose isomerase [Paenibacillus sp.]|jgi:sugar phosphate isomerase/epimerase|nr:xylose isomerase [Paenibacillus sp.]